MEAGGLLLYPKYLEGSELNLARLLVLPRVQKDVEIVRAVWYAHERHTVAPAVRIRLVELKQKLSDLNNFVSRFFTIATTENDVLKKGKDGHTVGVKFASVDDEISSIKATIANKIQKFI